MRRTQLLTSLALIILLLGGLPGSTAAQTTPEVAAPFRDYYARYSGIRVLGPPISDLREVNGFPVQYFEKGRLEDHRSETNDPNWRFMYGRLTMELIDGAPTSSVSRTDVTYADLAEGLRSAARVAPPANFQSGTMPVRQGQFIPYDSQLRRAPGYIVPLYFWNYMNRADLFPGGWLHDIGLPVGEAFRARTIKGQQTRDIMLQPFERTVLTYDPQNPAAWQIERANIGTDALGLIPGPLPPPSSPLIEIPAAGAQVTLPLHILARVGQPGQQVIAVLRWGDGTELTQILPVLRGEDGNGLVIDSIDWQTESQPPQARTTRATLELRSSIGETLARQSFTVLDSEQSTQLVLVYFQLGDSIEAEHRRIPRTTGVGRAALEELLWGPGPRNLAGFTTALPTPKEVLSYPGRAANWGPRVRLLGLTIDRGVATANFSKELRAYGGGSARVQAIRAQITRTLTQFESVREVRIAIEGQTEGVLEP